MDTSTAITGPGKAYRRGMSLAELFRLFPDNATAEAWFAEQRWGGGKPICPACGHHDVQTGCAHKTMPYRCRHRECRKRFSVKVGTIMESSNLDYQTWAIAIYLHTTSLKGVSSMKLHRDLGITQKSAWHLAHRIRAAYGAGEEETFAGPVEADEAYFGGKQKNKRDRTYIGRGAIGKTIVAGVKDRETNHVSAAVVESTKRRELQRFVAQRASVAADHFTDELASYRGLPNHTAVRHSIGEYVRGQAHINGMESFWSGLKRAYYGDVPPDEPEAPRPLRHRVLRPTQHPPPRHHRPDANRGAEDARPAAPVPRPHRAERTAFRGAGDGPLRKGRPAVSYPASRRRAFSPTAGS